MHIKRANAASGIFNHVKCRYKKSPTPMDRIVIYYKHTFLSSCAHLPLYNCTYELTNNINIKINNVRVNTNKGVQWEEGCSDIFHWLGNKEKRKESDDLIHVHHPVNSAFRKVLVPYSKCSSEDVVGNARSCRGSCVQAKLVLLHFTLLHLADTVCFFRQIEDLY